jgi:hypothetical protein
VTDLIPIAFDEPPSEFESILGADEFDVGDPTFLDNISE